MTLSWKLRRTTGHTDTPLPIPDLRQWVMTHCLISTEYKTKKLLISQKLFVPETGFEYATNTLARSFSNELFNMNFDYNRIKRIRPNYVKCVSGLQNT